MATVGFCDVMTAERDYHDEFYAGRGRMPFNAGSYAFTDEDVRRWCGDIWQDGAHFRGTRTKRMLDLLETDQVAGRRVLDLGCGNGQYAVLLAKRGAFACGCDISPIGVGIAREIATANGVADRCQFIVADATDLPWPSGAFDIVLLNAALQHLLKYPGLKGEILRVLRPGGRVVVADIVAGNPVFNTLKHIYRSWNPEADYGEDPDLDEYREFFAGLEDVRLEPRCLLEGVKRLLPDRTRRSPPCRALLRAAAVADAALLRRLPGLGRYCLEVTGTARKPG